MHTSETPAGRTYHHNSDFSGQVWIRLDAIELEVADGEHRAYALLPLEDLRAIVAAADRAALEQAVQQRPGPPPKGRFCDRHFSWLCQAGQGRCQSEVDVAQPASTTDPAGMHCHDIGCCWSCFAGEPTHAGAACPTDTCARAGGVPPLKDIRYAADLIRERATAASPDSSRTPLSVDRRPGAAAEWQHLVKNYLGGEIGEHCTAWTPQVALAVADWLDCGADPYWCGDRRPMAPIVYAYLGRTAPAAAQEGNPI